MDYRRYRRSRGQRVHLCGARLGCGAHALPISDTPVSSDATKKSKSKRPSRNPRRGYAFVPWFVTFVCFVFKSSCSKLLFKALFQSLCHDASLGVPSRYNEKKLARF